MGYIIHPNITLASSGHSKCILVTRNRRASAFWALGRGPWPGLGARARARARGGEVLLGLGRVVGLGLWGVVGLRGVVGLHGLWLPGAGLRGGGGEVGAGPGVAVGDPGVAGGPGAGGVVTLRPRPAVAAEAPGVPVPVGAAHPEVAEAGLVPIGGGHVVGHVRVHPADVSISVDAFREVAARPCRAVLDLQAEVSLAPLGEQVGQQVVEALRLVDALGLAGLRVLIIVARPRFALLSLDAGLLVEGGAEAGAGAALRAVSWRPATLPPADALCWLLILREEVVDRALDGRTLLPIRDIGHLCHSAVNRLLLGVDPLGLLVGVEDAHKLVPAAAVPAPRRHHRGAGAHVPALAAPASSAGVVEAAGPRGAVGVPVVVGVEPVGSVHRGAVGGGLGRGSLLLVGLLRWVGLLLLVGLLRRVKLLRWVGLRRPRQPAAGRAAAVGR